MKRLNPITEKYLFVFLSVFIFTLIGQIIIQISINDQKNNSTIVNTAGRQRMLSQKVVKLLLNGEKKELSKTLRRFLSAHEYLKTQLPDESSKLFALEPMLYSIEEGATCQEDCQRLITKTIVASDDFLLKMDQFVYFLEEKFDSQINRLSLIEYLIFFIIAMIMVYEFLYVLLPFQRKLDLENNKLIYAAKISSVGEMSAGLACEINNPLAIIHGSATILKNKISDDSKTFMDNILEASDRIKKISNSLQRFSKDEDQSDETEEISVTDAIEEAIYFNSFSKKDFKKIEFISVNLENFFVIAESTQLSQVLVYIIGNSIDAISHLDKPWIRITTKKFHGKVEIQITDSAEGISQSDAEKIFSPFYSSRKKPYSAGLGLSLSRDIIRKFGGDITYLKEDGNTSFKITLPSP